MNEYMKMLMKLYNRMIDDNLYYICIMYKYLYIKN